MERRNTRTAYGSVHRALHWTVAVLVLGQLLIGDVILLAMPDHVPTLSEVVHPTVGILIGLLMVGRLVWRERNVRPDEPKDIGVSGITVSSLTHYAWYALLIVNPVVGYVLANASGLPITFLGIPLPSLVPKGPTADNLFFRLHGALGVSIGALFLLHVAGALSHEFLLRDNVLRRMLGFPRMSEERQRRQERWPVDSPGREIDERLGHEVPEV